MDSDNGRDVAAKTVDALERLTVAIRTFGQQVASTQGLSQLQVQLLSALAAGPPPSPNVDALRRELQLAQPTVSDAVATLTTKGLVVREPDPADRRRHRLSLTVAGHETAAAIARQREQLVTAVAALPPDEGEQVLDSLLRLITQFHSAGVITVARTCLTCRFHELRDVGHHCHLLNTTLAPGALRVNCAEHEESIVPSS